MQYTKLYYPINAQFQIKFADNESDITLKLTTYIIELGGAYNNKLFWTLNYQSRSIVPLYHEYYDIDDIVVQFQKIFKWLFNKKCGLLGYFFCRHQAEIQYISTNNYITSNYKIYTQIDVDSLLYANSNIDIIDPVQFVLLDTFKIIKNTINGFDKHIEFFENTNNDIANITESINMYYNKLNTRIKILENDVKYLKSTNKFICKCLTYTGIATITVFYACYLGCVRTNSV